MAPKSKDAQPAEEASRVSPKTAKDFNFRGWEHRVRHELAEAESDFRQAIKMDAKDSEATYGLAQVLMEQGKKDDAVKTFKQAIKLLDSGALSDDPIRAGMLQRQALGHIERLTKGKWDLVSIGNAIPKGK